MLKRVLRDENPYEAILGRYLTTTQRSANSRNHCVPILEVLDVLDDPDYQILVMPLLREHNNPPFTTSAEVVELLRQCIEVRPLQKLLASQLSQFLWLTIHARAQYRT